jgi:DNA-directed RNA polymerase subunit RPC12/RpoP
MTTKRPLITHCTVCCAEVEIDWEIVIAGDRVACPQCGSHLLIWYLIDQINDAHRREGRLHE